MDSNNLDTIKLVIFDMNGTLTNTPFIDKQLLHVLPGRVERCEELSERGIALAIASNQGGVAFGFTTEALANAEVEGIAEQIGAAYFHVACGHPSPKRGFERYSTPEQLAMRKPAPGMINALMQSAGFAPSETLVVGDMEEDAKAAEAAGVEFEWASIFFADAKQFILEVVTTSIGITNPTIRASFHLLRHFKSELFEIHAAVLEKDLDELHLGIMNGWVEAGDLVAYKVRPVAK